MSSYIQYYSDGRLRPPLAWATARPAGVFYDKAAE